MAVFYNFLKYELHQSGWAIHHHDQICKEILNLLSEISNLACNTYYGHICLSATFRRNQTFTNQDDLYIILTGFSRRFWIWSQNVHIQPVASTVGIFLLNLYLDTWWYSISMDPTMKIIYKTSRQHVCTYVSGIRRFYFKYFTTGCPSDMIIIYAL